MVLQAACYGCLPDTPLHMYSDDALKTKFMREWFICFLLVNYGYNFQFLRDCLMLYIAVIIFPLAQKTYILLSQTD